MGADIQYVCLCVVYRFYGCESPELDYSTLTCLQSVPVENLILNTTNKGFDISKGGYALPSGTPPYQSIERVS